MTALTTLRLPAGVLGAATEPVTHLIDARWLMAYAAGLGETDGHFYDTRTPAGLVAHPLFPVCYEWPSVVTLRERVIGDELAPLSVHATHDLVIARMPRAGETVTTAARVIAIERRRAGALDGHPAHHRRCATVVPSRPRTTAPCFEASSRPRQAASPTRSATTRCPTPPPVRWTEPVEVTAGMAHVYTECARIWNPIHTDAAVAHAAGLPAIILHGTATLALAVSRVVARDLGGDAARVRRVRARFTGFVRLPSVLTVQGHGRAGTAIAFDAAGPDGTSVLGQGALST